MRSLQDYIAEESQRATGPVVGDDFAIVLEEDCLLETHVIDVVEDGYVLAADATLVAMLESHGAQLEDHVIPVQSTDSELVAVAESGWDNTQAELSLILDRAGITEGEYGDERIQGFYVVITDEESGPFVGMVVRDGGRWRERGGRGSRPNNWGATYMSYLAPEEVMQWIRQDYGRGAEVKGPFYDDDEAYRYADMMSEAEYQGREVTLNKPMPNTDGKSKSKVYVKDPQTGNVKKVTFGDPDMRIKKSNPERRKSFRARHKCDTAKDKTTARYWSCKAW